MKRLVIAVAFLSLPLSAFAAELQPITLSVQDLQQLGQMLGALPYAQVAPAFQLLQQKEQEAQMAAMRAAQPKVQPPADPAKTP